MGTPSYPTRPDPIAKGRLRRTAWTRRFAVFLFALPILGAALGVFGLRHADARAEASGYELRVRYPEISRAGIASPLDVYVFHDDGFDDPVTLEITHEDFTLFHLNAIYPAPSSETVSGDKLVWEFTACMVIARPTRRAPSNLRGIGSLGRQQLHHRGSFDTRLAA